MMVQRWEWNVNTLCTPTSGKLGVSSCRDSSRDTCAHACRVSGFTMLELMIVVAIVAILGAIALPSYSAHVMRSKISEATGNLSDMRNRMEQYFLDKRRFPDACVPAAAGPAPAGQIYYPAAMKYFTVVCDNMSATTYTIKAIGEPAEGMGGFEYWLDQGNNRVTKSTPAGWGGAGSACWVTKKDGSC